MAQFHETTFTNQEIDLDGNSFTHCIFENCTLVFAGSDLLRLAHCQFDGCEWKLAGAASNTMAFMKSLYWGMGDGGRNLVESTFDNIRRPIKSDG